MTTSTETTDEWPKIYRIFARQTAGRKLSKKFATRDGEYPYEVASGSISMRFPAGRNQDRNYTSSSKKASASFVWTLLMCSLNVGMAIPRSSAISDAFAPPLCWKYPAS